jgi:hypothetical protein
MALIATRRDCSADLRSNTDVSPDLNELTIVSLLVMN